MMRKLKYFFVTLLGFSTACSSVKQAPREKERQKDGDSTVVVGDPEASERPSIVVMYGVRRPVSDSMRPDLSRPLPEKDARTDDK